MADKKFPKSELPIRKTSELLPKVFQSPVNEKFMEAVVDPLFQPGVLEKTVGYVGRRYGKTFRGSDIYLDTDATLRSAYQLEPAVIYKNKDKIEGFYDYIDFKNQIKFFGNNEERDTLTTSQKHYSWNPPIDWDKFVNYREYYWVPAGPPSVFVLGNRPSVTSSYTVVLGTGSSFIFRPDGQTNNPTITLYRGQTYKFRVNAPGQGFVIRSNYDSASLLFNPNKAYSFGNLVVYDDKLWRALGEVIPGNTPFEGSLYWGYVDLASSETALDYNKGVTNNGTENGIVTFQVPFDSPDFLYYQSKVDADRFGKFIVADIETDTTIDINKEIIGKSYYTSSNGVEFSNGLVVEFRGRVAPAQYSNSVWLIEGVGEGIELIKLADLEVPAVNNTTLDVLFDNSGFDSEPYDDATNYPGIKDYFTIGRSSIDKNPWSRYNRWFHRSVLEFSYKFRGQDFPAPEADRAKRPIIEFQPNLQLFNHGAVAKASVDYIEDFNTDIFSTIEGSDGYYVDGEQLFDGARILVVSDTDILVNNKIYEVRFITHLNRRQITLKETVDSISSLGECLLIKSGKHNSGLMYHFDGEKWIKSQQKLSVNQPPLFDVFDEDEISYSDISKYPINNFKGTKLLSYKQGNGPKDLELGISLSYLNIDNVGDIEFDWNWGTDTFLFTKDQLLTTQYLNVGYFKFNPDNIFDNGWIETNNTFIQPILDSVVLTEDTTQVVLSTLDWDNAEDAILNFYLNGVRIKDLYDRNGDTFTFNRQFKNKDVVSVKIITSAAPRNGYYEIPAGLEKNPINAEPTSFTLGQAADHVASALEFNNEFSGTIPGVSNLRDLADYRQNTKRFMKHGSIAPLAVSLLCDKSNNVIKSLQYSKKAYSSFKSNFLTRATELGYNDNIADFVDQILADITKTKTQESAFFDSDMIGTGAYTSIDYQVEDEGIRTFALSTKFNLREQSRKAVYVYVNGEQLLIGRDYNFDNTFGFITVVKDVQLGDNIQIREYVSTSSCFIPATPTKLGLYKKYTPTKFLDDTYREPREVIQGHDGSITFTYGDFRDDLLLELEYRIYNNIKQEYDESVLDVDSIIGGYYGSSEFNKEQLDSVVIQEFLRWIQNSDVNYTLNSYFVDTEPFTYTYSNMTDPTGTVNLPGWWRGVYQWFYDTDRPHRCPWEMLGFSQQPDWWESEYGPAPYTGNNLVLWEDLASGIIRQGSRAGIYDRYKRPSLINHIPVDGDGILLNPLDSGLAGNFVLTNNKGNFKFGDINPAEYAWRSSSEWPFAVMIALTLLKPFDSISNNFDRTQVSVNKLGQVVNRTTNRFITISDISFPSLDKEPSSGLINYLVDYAKSKRMSTASVENKIKNLNVALSTRLSGFADKSQQRYLLDSKNPRSSASSVFVPPENYDIIFNVSTPIQSIAYSGVVLEKTSGGWVISGYDSLQPYFNYYSTVPNQRDPVITVGGVSEAFSNWSPDTTYNNGQVVQYKNDFYRATKTHRSSATFDISVWRKLPELPIVGGTTALRSRNFNSLIIRRLSYGTKLTSIQEVVDFLLGYEHYLKSQGFSFDGYDKENQVSQNWLTSCKEFMFWTKQNWAEGSIITLSPAASAIELTVPIGVADNLLDSFYDYQIFKSDGTVLDTRFINVSRSFQKLVVSTTNTTEGIYYLRLHYVLKEHVTVFTDRTVFNDVIYDKTTGYRQERIKAQGFRTTDWDGDYTSPGFIFDNVNIEAWQPFTDYKLGDIVEYQSRYWTSQENQLESEIFDDTKWSRLDTTPEKQLVANFDYKANLFDDYYDVASEGVGQSQRELARHAIGYQERQYLQDLAEDPITQFQLYQGFIREKGTANAITKVFDKLSRAGEDSITLNEEWAVRVGRFGGLDQIKEIEFGIEKDNFLLDPQPIIISNDYIKYPEDQYYRITSDDFTLVPVPYTTNVNLVGYTNVPFKTAGYVRNDQVEYILASRDDILDLDINSIAEDDTVWITFDTAINKYWSVLKYNDSQDLEVVEVLRSESTVSLTINRPHSVEVGDIIGIKNIANLSGFFKVVDPVSELIDSSLTTITVEIAEDAEDPELDFSTPAVIGLFSNVRFSNYNVLEEPNVALLNNGAKLWIDNNNNGRWEVVQKKKQYTSKLIASYGGLENFVEGPIGTGSKVLYDSIYKQVITSIPQAGYALSYADSGTALPIRSIIQPPETLRTQLNNSFGFDMALSPDSRWLVVTAPNASNIAHNYIGEYNPALGQQFVIGDIVSYEGKYWVAIRDFESDGTPIDLNTGDWLPAAFVEASEAGSQPGAENQGAIFIYERSGQIWNLVHSVLSPEPAANEQFGYSVALGQNGSNYYLVVSALGYQENKGRVYLYKYEGSWQHDDAVYIIDEDSSLGDNDYFGYSLAISRDATILAVGAPQIFNEIPENKGKVFVYQKNSQNTYNLVQSITATELLLIDDSDSAGVLGSGDQFGYSLTMDYSGSTLIIGCPDADLFNNDQGAVYILRTEGFVEIEYRLKQKIFSYELHPQEFFGRSVSITANSEKIAIGASNRFYDDGRGFAGAVYVFERKADNYFLTEKLEAEFSPNESFGYSIAVSDTTVAVGSPKYIAPVIVNGSVTYPGNEIGTVRVFKKQEGVSSWEVIATQQPIVDIDKIKSIALFDTVNNEKISDIDFVDPAKLKILNIAEQEITFKTPYDPAVYSVGTNNETQTVELDLAWTDKHVGEIWWDLSTAKWVYYEQGDIAYRTGNWGQLAVGARIDVYEWVSSRLLPSEWSVLADTNEGLAENISGQPLYPEDTVYSFKELYNEYTGLPTGTIYYYWVKNTVVLPVNKIGRRISADQIARTIADPKSLGQQFISAIDSDKFLTYNFASLVNKTGTVLNIDYYVGSRNSNAIHNEYQLITEGIANSLPAKSIETKWIDSLVGYDIARNPVPDPKLPVKQKYGISFRPRQNMFVDRFAALRIAVDYINSVLLKDTFTNFISFANLESVDTPPAAILNEYDIVVDSDIDLIGVVTSRLKQAALSVNIIDGEIDSVNIINHGFGYKVPPRILLDGDGTGAKIEVEIDDKGRIKTARVVTKGKRYSKATAEIRPFSVLVNNDSLINNFWSIYSWDQARSVFFRSKSQAFDTRQYWAYVDWWKAGYSTGSRIVKEIVTVAQEPTIDLQQGDLLRIKEYGSGGWAVFERNSTQGGFFLDRYIQVGRENGTIQLSESLFNTKLSGIGYDATQSFDIGNYDLENFLELRNILTAVKEDIFIGDYSAEWNKLFFASIRYVFSEQQYVDWAFKTSFLNAIHNVGGLEQKLNYKGDSLSNFQEYIDEVKPYRTTIREYVSKYSNLENTNTAVTDFDLPSTYSTVDGKIITVTEQNELINQYPWKWWLDNKGYSIIDIQISNPGSGYVQPPTVLIEGNGTGAEARAYITNGKVSAIVVLNQGQGYTETPIISLVGGNNNNSNIAKSVAILGNGKVRNIRIGVKFDRITKEGQYQTFIQEETFTASGFDSGFNLSYPPSRDKSKIQVFINDQISLSDEYSVSIYRISTGTYTYNRGKIIFVSAPTKGSVVKVIYEKDDSILDSVNRINKYYEPNSGMKGKDLPQLMTGIDFGGVQIQGSSFGLTGGWDALPWYTDAWDAVDPSGDFYYVFIAPTYESDRIYRPSATVLLDNKIYKLEGLGSSDPLDVPGESGSRWQHLELDVVELPYVPQNGHRVNVYRNLKNTSIAYDQFKQYFVNDVIRFQSKYYKSTYFGIIQDINPKEDYSKWQEISETYRVDDPAWNANDSSMITNLNALMPTFVGDGVSNQINVGAYFTVLPGETLIFRPEESDGSNTILSNDVIDTNLIGGTLSVMSGAFITAQGVTAEEIVVEGGVYISSDFVPAPEENVPGQVLDSLSIKVFHSNPEDLTVVFGFEMHKDMLNKHYYKRYSIGQYQLARDLNYYDTEMILSNDAGLIVPALLQNIPGEVQIEGERIEFLYRNSTTLGRLRRGSQGTAIGVLYPAGTPVVNISYDQSLPYKEDTLREDFFYNTERLVYDGSSNSFKVSDPVFIGGITTSLVDGVEVLVGNKDNIVIKITNSETGVSTEISRNEFDVLVDDNDIYVINISLDIEINNRDVVVVYPLLVGPLSYVPQAVGSTISPNNSWYRDSIPNMYGQCDEIELFVGGRRKFKTSTSRYDETKGVVSPSADIIIESDFAVDGVSTYIRLTEPIENAGTRITVIKRTGRIWYERGEITASKGVSLLDNNTPVARFIAQKTTDLPE